MQTNTAKSQLGAGIVLLAVVLTSRLGAQSGAVLSGTVTWPAGAAVANAKVSVKNVATGQVTRAQTNASGAYSANLAPGDYEVTSQADGLSKTAHVTVAARGRRSTSSFQNRSAVAAGDPHEE
jgi:hypothetical protein